MDANKSTIGSVVIEVVIWLLDLEETYQFFCTKNVVSVSMWLMLQMMSFVV